jgi:hypothetical protein
MHTKWQVTGLIIILNGILVFLAGCLDGNNNDGQDTIPQLDSVGPLLAEWDDWDNDGMDDGIRLGFYFMDQSGNIIAFDNVEVFVTAELYTQVNTTSIQGEKGHLVYSNIFTITSSEDAHPLHGSALRIPAEEITVDPETDYYLGILDTSVSVPHQGEFSLPPDNYIRLYH